tara:strand:- start:6634 stop:7782 length:1149 start_codon:yes stop_codon:yes gene_type:complete
MFSRQPLVDASLTLHGYVLDFNNLSGASTQVVFDVLSSIDFDKLGDAPTFVKIRASQIDEELLTILDSNYVRLLLEGNFPEAVVIECVERHFALGLCRPNSTTLHLLKYCDYAVLSPEHYQSDRLKQIINKLHGKKLTIIADHIKEQSQLQNFGDCGFDLFSGDLIVSKVEKASSGASGYNRLVLVKLLTELQNPDCSVDKLEQIFAQDSRLSYKLIDLINSPAYSRTRDISSVKDAIVFLGLKDVKKWISLLVLSNIDDKPYELMVQTMLRAKLCELVATELGRTNIESYFTVGLFSTLDNLMDQPMESLLEQLPVDESLSMALLCGAGELGEVLQAVINYQASNWQALDGLDISSVQLRMLYLKALYWVSESIASLGMQK